VLVYTGAGVCVPVLTGVDWYNVLYWCIYTYIGVWIYMNKFYTFHVKHIYTHM
jgi:hypothetical protein